MSTTNSPLPHMSTTATSAPTVDKLVYEQVNRQFGECLISKTFLDDFYTIFTGKSAEIRNMFAKTDMKAQKDALRSGLTFLVMYAKGDGGDFVASKLDRLGKSHSQSQMNIRPDLYPLWIESLMQTVKKHLPKLTPADERGWRAVLQLGVNRIASHYKS